MWNDLVNELPASLLLSERMFGCLNSPRQCPIQHNICAALRKENIINFKIRIMFRI